MNLKKYCLAALIALSVVSNSSAEETALTTIEWVKGIFDYQNRVDLIIQVANLGSNFSGDECSRGLWLDSSAPGFNLASSMILAAYQAKTQVVVNVDKTMKWPGSGDDRFCKAAFITYGTAPW